MPRHENLSDRLGACLVARDNLVASPPFVDGVSRNYPLAKAARTGEKAGSSTAGRAQRGSAA
jgi:hypothetical protein